MALIVIVFLLSLGLLGYILYRRRVVTKVESNQVSHFSSLGFLNLFDESEWNLWTEKTWNEGKPVENWRVLSSPEGVELWCLKQNQTLAGFSPFFRKTSFNLKVLDSRQMGADEWMDRLEVQGLGTLIAERIPVIEAVNDRWSLTAFGLEVTLYDSPENYESMIRNPYKTQIISISELAMISGEKTDWTADILVSGLVTDFERVVNSLTGQSFWLTMIQLPEGIILPAVWDHRLTKRYPQKKNVVVGRFHLMASPEWRVHETSTV